jgi:hypothetical protein
MNHKIDRRAFVSTNRLAELKQPSQNAILQEMIKEAIPEIDLQDLAKGEG